MSKIMLANYLLILCVLELIFPNIAFLKENEIVKHPQSELIIHIRHGEHDGEFGYRAFSEGFPVAPKAFAVDKIGNIYVGDSENNRIQVFDSKGKFIRKIDLDKSNRKFPLIVDIAIDKKRDLLNVLMLRENIQIYNLKGQHVKTLPLKANLDRDNKWTYALWQPQRIAVDIRENIYISGFDNSLVKLDIEGNIIQKWSHVDYYIDPDGNLYIMELKQTLRGKVIKFSPEGNKLLEGTCSNLFPAPVKDCRLPEFIDKYGRMYHRKSSDMYVFMYTKQKNVLLGMDIYEDEDGYYYKVDNEGNLYTIKEYFIKYQNLPD